MATYKSGTHKLFEELRSKEAKIRSTRSGVVIKGKSGDMLLAGTKDGLRDVVNGAMLQGEEKKDFALRIGISPSLLSKITSMTDNRKPTRDHILRVLLLYEKVMSPDEVQDVLKRGLYPELYTKTTFLRVNRRNYLLHKIFAFASQADTCPCKDWASFANAVIHHFNVHYIGNPAEFMNLIGKTETVEALPTDMVRTVHGWAEEFLTLTACRYVPFRQDLKKRFLERHPARSMGFVSYMSYVTGDDSANISRWFDEKPSADSIGSRGLSIRIAAALGCSVEECNRLLRCAGQAILYPHDEEETRLIQDMMCVTSDDGETTV